MNKDILGADCSCLKNKKLFLFDMDGTIYLENKLFDGVFELLEFIKNNGGKYLFLTNNSSKSVLDYLLKLKGLGLNVSKENFFTSTQASILLLKKQFDDKLVYVQGTKSFVQELLSSGINVTTEYYEDISAVLVGFDTELTGEKLRTTCKVLTKLNVPYYATNPDWVCPVEFGYVPDCGSMCFGIEKATGKKPIFIGKPNPTMINFVLDKFNIKKEQAVIFGDRLYTDILSGINAGIDTVFVLSGEGKLEDCKNNQIFPNYILNSVKDVL